MTTVVVRGSAKRADMQLMLPSSRVDAVQRELTALRARPALWIGSGRYEATIIYGRYKEFQIDLQAGANSFCSLSIVGLV